MSEWIKLKLDSHMSNSTEDIDRNIEHALGLEYVSFQTLVGTESGAVSVVGSGPSLRANWQKLRDMDGDIIACNASCQFLLERGIVPKYMFCFDADPLMLEFITPHPEITFLFASRCPPEAFEMLEGCKLVIWHATGDENLQSLLEKHHKMEPMVAGGTAAITRAMVLAQPLGYSEIHLWGADSSFLNGDTHIRKSTTEEKYLPVMVNNRAFECAPWMAQQAEDFKILAPILRDDFGMKIVVHGDGLLPHLAKAMGFRGDGGYRWKEVKEKARTLWSQL